MSLKGYSKRLATTQGKRVLRKSVEFIRVAMHNEITADALLTVASPNIAGIPDNTVFLESGGNEICDPDRMKWYVEDNESALRWPRFDCPSVRSLTGKNAPVIIRTVPHDNAVMKGIQDLPQAIKTLELSAIRHYYALERGLLGIGTFKGWVMRKLLFNMVIRSLATATANLFAHVLEFKRTRGKKARYKHKRICTSKERFVKGKNNREGGIFYDKYNGHVAFKMRPGRPALSLWEWNKRKVLRYKLRKKTDRRNRKRNKQNGKLRLQQIKFTPGHVLYGRPTFRRKKRAGSLLSRIKNRIKSQLPVSANDAFRHKRYWQQGYEYWVDVFVTQTVEQLKNELKVDENRTKKKIRRLLRKELVDSIIIPSANAVAEHVKVRIIQPIEGWIEEIQGDAFW